MTSVLCHFNKCRNEDRFECDILSLKHDEIEEFLSKLPFEFRRCYVTDKKIKHNIKKLSMDANEIIRNYLPDKGNVMSGEFGEIFSFFLLKERYLPLRLYGPRKWLWKIDRNRPLQYTDVILFYRVKSVPDKGDFVVSAETKMKATKNKQYNPIQDAFNGATLDSISRLAITLTWLRQRSIKSSDQKSVDFLNRFIKSTESVEYGKHFKAIAIMEEILLKNELSKKIDIKNTDNNLEIVVVAIKGLKSVYQETYERIIACSI